VKSINILSVTQAFDSLDEVDSFELYLKHYGVKTRTSEVEDLKSLVAELNGVKRSIHIFERFYLGYKIPQISKEFDLLRFGENYIVNIELKRISTRNKIKKQLIRNKYYLSYTGKEIHNLCYEADSKTIYSLKSDDTLKVINFDQLENLLLKQTNSYIKNIDKLFNPSDYLVSPFNSTSKFLKDYYFLTSQQEEVKAKVLNSLAALNTTNFISILGSAGTGKTLLVYDFVKNLIGSGKKPLIIHCGSLNEGHEELKRQGWDIISIKSYSVHSLKVYDVIIIDEAQRIYPNQLEKIVDLITVSKGSCIFSYDKLQTLAKWEEDRDIDGKINKISNIKTYKLSEKIRTNKEIATFIKMLFNSKRNLNLQDKGNIEVNYFHNLGDAKVFLESLDGNEWEVLRFTPSQYKREHHEKYSMVSGKTSHKVIGQEFDGVAITIDQFFTYDNNGELFYSGNTYYYPVKMLFQNITRARKKVNLVIINNEELLKRCMQILQ